MTEQQEASEDAVMTRIGQAVILLHAGDREEARNRLGEIWSEIGEEGDSLHRCTLAHYMADAQDDPADELAWDLRALTAADALGHGPGPGSGPPDGRPAQREPYLAMRVFYPSLHLSLATDYVKLQRPEAARVHLARARAATGALSDDGYGNGVRAAIARLERRLAEEPGTAPRPFPEQFP
uniref:Tetratricopeptide repeat protein n=1 Tax=Streptomyces sp. NBC_00049 TaxID=2903617 RepID=A0AAU2K0Z6_9ACTN